MAASGLRNRFSPKAPPQGNAVLQTDAAPSSPFHAWGAGAGAKGGIGHGAGSLKPPSAFQAALQTAERQPETLAQARIPPDNAVSANNGTGCFSGCLWVLKSFRADKGTQPVRQNKRQPERFSGCLCGLLVVERRFFDFYFFPTVPVRFRNFFIIRNESLDFMLYFFWGFNMYGC